MSENLSGDTPERQPQNSNLAGSSDAVERCAPPAQQTSDAHGARGEPATGTTELPIETRVRTSQLERELAVERKKRRRIAELLNDQYLPIEVHDELMELLR